MSWKQFCRMSGDDQAFHVAVYRTNQQIEAVIADDQAKTAKRNASKGKRTTPK
jgi:hypothetical protein